MKKIKFFFNKSSTENATRFKGKNTTIISLESNAYFMYELYVFFFYELRPWNYNNNNNNNSCLKISATETARGRPREIRVDTFITRHRRIFVFFKFFFPTQSNKHGNNNIIIYNNRIAYNGFLIGLVCIIYDRFIFRFMAVRACTPPIQVL